MRLSIRPGLVVLLAALEAGSALRVSGGDTITTIAGLGTTGFSGDGGQATGRRPGQPI